ncbi:MAG: hypothetical protein HY270_17865 [Deltaproteobacteria bacterium]|nr:hypothetical protein [Deltaproteobacteria bacterium]
MTGTLVATYHVSTQITLPRVSDYGDLTPCQRRRIKDAIDNTLAPHEREHVRAYTQYNGTTRRPFDLTLCRNELNAAIRAMFQDEEASRRSAAQAASDALDPFDFPVDLECGNASPHDASSAVSDDSQSGQADDDRSAGFSQET